MAAGTLPAVIGGANKNTLVIYDGNGNVAASLNLVNSSGVEIGTAVNPIIVQQTGSSIATGQVNVGTSPTQIVPARAGRRSVTIIQEGTTLVRLGPSGVSMSSGVPLPGTQYATFTFEGGATVFGIVASGSATLSYVEAF